VDSPQDYPNILAAIEITDSVARVERLDAEIVGIVDEPNVCKS
jgi:hypothetical protein